MSVFCTTQGRGTDLVFVHGWGMNGDVWETVTPELARNFRITLVDLPGHGRSVDHVPDYRLETIAAQVAEASPETCLLVGWSLGGLVAMQMALDFPSRVSKLILVATAPRFLRATDWPDGIEAETLDGFAGDLRTDFQATVKRFIAIQVMGSDHAGEQQRLLRERVFRHGHPQIAALEGGLRILRDTDLRARLPEIQCPVLMISGQHDTLFRPAAARLTQALFPRCQLEIVQGAGHAPFISHPHQFIESLTGFIYG